MEAALGAEVTDQELEGAFATMNAKDGLLNPMQARPSHLYHHRAPLFVARLFSGCWEGGSHISASRVVRRWFVTRLSSGWVSLLANVELDICSESRVCDAPEQQHFDATT